MKERALTGIIIVLIILLGGVIYVAWSNAESKGEPAPVAEVPLGVIYTNQDLGITFTQPDGYHLAATASDVSLIEEEAYAEFIQSTEPREAPPAILLSVFPLGDSTLIEAWLRENKGYSQYEDAKLERSEVAGVDAVSYEADGLYQTRYVAFLHNEKAYLFSVQFLDRSDSILTDFNRIIQSLTLAP